MTASTRLNPAIKPFAINIPQAALDDLQARLERTRWSDDFTEGTWNTGAPTSYLKELTEYWRTSYDWRKHEALLNQFAHFRTEVDGIGIHFIHERGKGPNPLPVLLTHGWPDSFYRFHKVIPMLTDPVKYGGNAEDSFDVIVPSIPGFGFSDHKPRSQQAVADLWLKLMRDVLGYSQFAAAGGDVGSIVTKALAYKYPEAVTAIHLTDVGYPTGQEDFSTMSAPEMEFATYIQNWWFAEGAFNMIQSTKPQMLGYGLNDSPVGWAAWSMSLLNDPTGQRIPRDELLTNIMIYWLTETIVSSIRSYHEGTQDKPITRVDVPSAVAHCTLDAPLPREWAERQVNLKRYTQLEGAGHFAAWEKPELFANDLREFLRDYRK
jgi:epoxide hydrolase